MRTRAKKKRVASDRTRRKNVPRHSFLWKTLVCRNKNVLYWFDILLRMEITMKVLNSYVGLLQEGI